MLTLAAGAARLDLDPSAGGRVVRLSLDGVDVLRTPEASAEHFGLFPMAPWAGRVRHGRFSFDGVEHQLPITMGPHAIHGTVRDRMWAVTARTDGAVTITCDLGPDWPFDGWAAQTVALHEDRLELELSVHARSGRMPAAAGWHPWFRNDGVELELDAGSMYVRDDEHMATRELVSPPPPGPWDDCFTDLRAPPLLRWPDGPALTIDTSCPCVVVFSEPEETICVEPQTAPPDALNHDATVVTPDAPLVATTTLRWA